MVCQIIEVLNLDPASFKFLPLKSPKITNTLVVSDCIFIFITSGGKIRADNLVNYNYIVYNYKNN